MYTLYASETQTQVITGMYIEDERLYWTSQQLGGGESWVHAGFTDPFVVH